ncbi:MAG: hypothetical protein ACREFX_01640 [Opitutaceae bacterium]
MNPKTPEIEIRFGTEERADPCGPFPELTWRGRPYNLALTDAVLIPFLGERERAGSGGREALGRAAGAALELSTEAFRAVLPQAAHRGDEAVLAALTVTANLQRTVERLVRDPRAGAVLSRAWCGFPPEAVRRRPKSGRSKPEAGPAVPDLRPLARALRCSYADIREQSDQALAALRQEIQGGVLFAPEDLPAPAMRRR